MAAEVAGVVDVAGVECPPLAVPPRASPPPIPRAGHVRSCPPPLRTLPALTTTRVRRRCDPSARACATSRPRRRRGPNAGVRATWSTLVKMRLLRRTTRTPTLLARIPQWSQARALIRLTMRTHAALPAASASARPRNLCFLLLGRRWHQGLGRGRGRRCRALVLWILTRVSDVHAVVVCYPRI